MIEAKIETKLKKPWWTPIAHFTGHTFVGTAIFTIVAIPAVGLSLLIKHLATWGVPEFTIKVLVLLEQAILVGDAMLFVVYLVLAAVAAFKEMLE